MLKNIRFWLLGIIAFVVLNGFILTPVRIQGQSMSPTLKQGSWALAPKYDYWLKRAGLGSYARGDIIYFRAPKNAPYLHKKILGFSLRPLYVKRIVALQGERIAIVQGQVLINGQALSESYVDALGSYNLAEQRVPQGQVFVIGDNRAALASVDSRYFGPIAIKEVQGRLGLVF